MKKIFFLTLLIILKQTSWADDSVGSLSGDIKGKMAEGSSTGSIRTAVGGQPSVPTYGSGGVLPSASGGMGGPQITPIGSSGSTRNFRFDSPTCPLQSHSADVARVGNATNSLIDNLRDEGEKCRRDALQGLNPEQTLNNTINNQILRIVPSQNVIAGVRFGSGSNVNCDNYSVIFEWSAAAAIDASERGENIDGSSVFSDCLVSDKAATVSCIGNQLNIMKREYAAACSREYAIQNKAATNQANRDALQQSALLALGQVDRIIEGTNGCNSEHNLSAILQGSVAQVTSLQAASAATGGLGLALSIGGRLLNGLIGALFNNGRLDRLSKVIDNERNQEAVQCLLLEATNLSFECSSKVQKSCQQNQLLNSSSGNSNLDSLIALNNAIKTKSAKPESDVNEFMADMIDLFYRQPESEELRSRIEKAPENTETRLLKKFLTDLNNIKSKVENGDDLNSDLAAQSLKRRYRDISSLLIPILSPDLSINLVAALTRDSADIGAANTAFNTLLNALNTKRGNNTIITNRLLNLETRMKDEFAANNNDGAAVQNLFASCALNASYYALQSSQKQSGYTTPYALSSTYVPTKQNNEEVAIYRRVCKPFICNGLIKDLTQEANMDNLESEQCSSINNFVTKKAQLLRHLNANNNRMKSCPN